MAKIPATVEAAAARALGKAARGIRLTRLLGRGRVAEGAGAARRSPSLARIAALSAAATAAMLLLAVAVLSVIGGPRVPIAVQSASTDLPPPPARGGSDAVGAEQIAAASATTVPEVGVDGGLTVAPYAPSAFAGMPMAGAEQPLSTAPDPALVETTPAGLLPRIGAEGRRPRDVYARPFDPRDDRSRLVVIVLDIGLNRAASEAAIRRLPGAVVLAIDPYASHPADWGHAARQAGHEVLAVVSLQGADGAVADAGPRALRAASEAEVRQRLAAALGRFTGYAGVLLRGGDGLGETLSRLSPALQLLRERGLLLVDGVAGAAAPLFQMAQRVDLPRARIDVAIGDGDAAAIDAKLAALEQSAREQFVAVGTIEAKPIALERLRAWIARIDPARYVLAPVSAVAAGMR